MIDSLARKSSKVHGAIFDGSKFFFFFARRTATFDKTGSFISLCRKKPAARMSRGIHIDSSCERVIV